MTAFLAPFVHAVLLLNQFVAHALLIAAMRVCLVLQHAAFGALAGVQLGLGGLILDAGESVAIALFMLWSLPGESGRVKAKPRKPTPRKRSQRAVIRRRRGTRPCPCRTRKRKK